jgi:hypothetical protein
MWDNLIKARWQQVFGQLPTGKHLEAFRQKMAHDLKIESYIKTTNDDDLIAILRQVAKDRTKDDQPSQSGAPQPGGGKP